MAHFNYNLREPQSESDTPVNLVVRWSNNRVVIPTGELIDPKFWETDKKKSNFQRAKKTAKFPDHNEFNTRLDNIIGIAKNVFRKYQNDHNQQEPNKGKYHELLKQALGKESKTDLYDTLIGFYGAYLEELKVKVNRHTNKPISSRTVESHSRTLNLLTTYEKAKRRRIDFDTITLTFYYDFCKYLKEAEEFNNNTIGKHIKNLKTVLNSATERGYNSNLAYKSKDFHIIKEESPSIYLNEDELNDMYKLDLSKNKRLERVRDLFIIGCYTGLRYSDFTRIRNDNIIDGFLRINTQKTSDEVVIPIFPIVQEILDKYNGKLPTSITNQKMNEYIKEVGKQVDSLKIEINPIDKLVKIKDNEKVFKYDLLTTHTARRSFATNMYNRGIPTITIMAITGHKTETEFLKYIKITPKDHAIKMMEYWKTDNIGAG